MSNKTITQDIKAALQGMPSGSLEKGVNIYMIGEIHIGHDKEIQVGNRFEASIEAGDVISSNTVVERQGKIDAASLIPPGMIEEFVDWFDRLPYPRFDIMAAAAFIAATRKTPSLAKTAEYLGLSYKTALNMRGRIQNQLPEG